MKAYCANGLFSSSAAFSDHTVLLSTSIVMTDQKKGTYWTTVIITVDMTGSENGNNTVPMSYMFHNFVNIKRRGMEHEQSGLEWMNRSWQKVVAPNETALTYLTEMERRMDLVKAGATNAGVGLRLP